MPIHCKYCDSTDFRISRFRMKDLARLMILHYPVRCWVCRERIHMPFLQMLRLRRDEELRRDDGLNVNKVQPS